MGWLSCTRVIWRHNFQRRYHVANFEWGHRTGQLERHSLQTSQLAQAYYDAQLHHPSVCGLIAAYRAHAFRQEVWNPLPASVRLHHATLMEPVEMRANKTNYMQSHTAASSSWKESASKLREVFPSLALAAEKNIPLDEMLDKVYSQNIGVEFEIVEDFAERAWLYGEFEKMQINALLQSETVEEQYRCALLAQKSLMFDRFLANKFPSVKRYSGEGAESTLISLETLFTVAAQEHSVSHIVIGAAHRCRNNILTILLNYPVVEYFAKIRGKSEFPAEYRATGDTFSHFSTSVTLPIVQQDAGGSGEKTSSLRVSLLPNPSHLEAVVPVAVGKCRSKMEYYGEGDYFHEDGKKPNARNGDSTLCVQVHGDAAMVGQGIVSETMAMSQVPHFSVGGSIHIVVNNQLGFTTEPSYGRSWRNCTDIAYTIGAPVLHVNGEDPLSVIRATKLAIAYRIRNSKYYTYVGEF